MNRDPLNLWPKERTGVPFDSKAWNRLANWLNGDQAGRAQIRDLNGLLMLGMYPEVDVIQSQVEWQLQLATNVYEPGIRAVLDLGATAGSQAATQDAVILIQNRGVGTGYRFKNGLLFGGGATAIDASVGKLINAEALTAFMGIDWSAVTFVTSTGRILKLPGISGRTGYELVPVNGTTGLRALVDLTNNTLKSRFLFQAGEVNSTSLPGLGVIAKSGEVAAGFVAYGSGNPDAAPYLYLGTSLDGQFEDVASGQNGSATLPIRFRIDATEVARITTAFALQLANTRWLDGLSGGGTPIHLIRVNGSIIELGVANQNLSFLAWLTNNVPLYWMNQAGSGGIQVLNLTTGDVIQLGATATRLSFLSPLVNATKLTGSNAANSAAINLIGVNASDEIEVGQAGTTLRLLGTVVVPSTTSIKGAIVQSGHAVGTTSSPDVTSGAYADVQEMSVTLASVVASNTLRVRFDGIFYNRIGANTATVALSLDGAAEVHEREVLLAAGSALTEMVIQHDFTGVSAGSRTVKVRLKTAGGTAVAYLTQRDLWVDEIQA